MCVHEPRKFPSLPAATLRQGYVFTPVCQSFWSQGGVDTGGTPTADIPRAGTPPYRRRPSPRQTATAADDTHPTECAYMSPGHFHRFKCAHT